MKAYSSSRFNCFDKKFKKIFTNILKEKQKQKQKPQRLKPRRCPLNPTSQNQHRRIKPDSGGPAKARPP